MRPRRAQVWDYQTKACVQTLEGHTSNVSAVCFHPELPVIVSASEDGSVKLWHSTTYRLEQTINYGMERVWAVGIVRGSNAIALGYDNGLVMLKLGNEEPVASMDASGKVIYARHNDVMSAAVKALGPDYELVDGERLPLPVKVCTSRKTLPCSRFAVCGSTMSSLSASGCHCPPGRALAASCLQCLQAYA
jgi:coatomer subunit beta'